VIVIDATKLDLRHEGLIRYPNNMLDTYKYRILVIVGALSGIRLSTLMPSSIMND
jgi:hypothetical protein